MNGNGHIKPYYALAVVFCIFLVFIGLALASNGFYNKIGTIKIDSAPQGGEIYIDGVYKGTTPEYTFLPIGEHTIQIYLSGYKTYEKEVVVDSGETTIVDAELEYKEFVPLE